MMEIDRLNQELRDVKEENENLRRSSWEGNSLELRVLPPTVTVDDEHHPPAPPKRPKKPVRTDILQ
jgi:hypothetical protein